MVKITKQTTGLDAITFEDLAQIQIPLPPLATQKRIAEILDASDALRRTDQALLKKYDELAQAIFIDMFGDPVKNEKGWDKVELSNFIARLETGVSVNSNDDKIDTIKKCVLKTSCVYTGYFNSAEAKVIVPLDLVRAKLNPVKDSIIISRMNTSELVGMSAYIDNDYPNLYLPDRLWMTVKSDKPHSTLWLSFALKSFAIREQIQKIASGTSGSMKNISKKDFLEIEIINPPYKLQRAFEDALNKINELKKYADINKGNVLFDSLIQKAFKGELVN
jgi:type I restriction enzyme S subunit